MPISNSAGPTNTSNQPTRSEPYWRSECGRAVIYVGDCRAVTAQMEPDQFHAVVTDPPYGLEFMGKEWDKLGAKIETCSDGTDRSHPFRDGSRRIVYGASARSMQSWFQECFSRILRVAKPGAHLLSFGGTRTYHRMTCAVEDAGFEIRDTIMWVYSQGFPKSHNIGKAIDKMMDAEREKVRTPMASESNVWMDKIGVHRPWKEKAKEVGYHEHEGDEPVTDAAKQWDGWGTALKPALEPVVVARKPFLGTVAQCVTDNGTGAINIDGCRVGTSGGSKSIPGSSPDYLNNIYGVGMGGTPKDPNYKNGRWPSNLIHDGSDEVVELFPQTTSKSAMIPLPKTPGDCLGQSHDRKETEEHWKQGGGGFSTVGRSTVRGFDDYGSAARFFYTAKADNNDRPHGKGATIHPTVKPLDLMQYLVRLVCAPGGTVLDPFMGSGSTGCAAILEGMRFVGIEQSQEYADIAVGRLKLALDRKRLEDTPGAPGTRAPCPASAPLQVKKLRG